MKLRTSILSIAFLAILAGCSSKLTIVVTWATDGKPVFTVYKAWPPVYLQRSENTELNSFLIVPNVDGSWDYKHPVWSFELPPGSYKPVGQIKYGEVPAGFEEQVKALPLVNGTQYQAVGFGPGSGGGVVFSIGQPPQTP